MDKKYNINNEFEKISNILLDNNYQLLFDEVKDIIQNTFSSTEMLFKLTYALNESCKRDYALKLLLNKNLIDLLDYCDSIGIIIAKR